MLSESEIANLRYGRIVLVGGVIDSLGKTPVGPHWAVILDQREDIEKFDNATVVMISHEAFDDRFLFPVPARTGLTGNVVCSWLPGEPIEFAAMLKIHPAILTDDEMLEIEKTIARYNKSKRVSGKSELP